VWGYEIGGNTGRLPDDNQGIRCFIVKNLGEIEMLDGMWQEFPPLGDPPTCITAIDTAIDGYTQPGEVRPITPRRRSVMAGK
jgi:hypothetical protein